MTVKSAPYFLRSFTAVCESAGIGRGQLGSIFGSISRGVIGWKKICDLGRTILKINHSPLYFSGSVTNDIYLDHLPVLTENFYWTINTSPRSINRYVCGNDCSSLVFKNVAINHPARLQRGGL
ncbi:uncharacterized protein LOC111028891 [Myzus persicae]|uniref:uncharacterized protein LOC111028891 n=1 Tax=Myzus persicae TaxID=13164 RepID=UPI000B933498|nr:uncharacterized protein LOC111028891 [Myzus persicae]